MSKNKLFNSEILLPHLLGQRPNNEWNRMQHAVLQLKSQRWGVGGVS